MTDWDALVKVTAKGNGFVGTTQSDEDAYFSAFADDELAVLPKLPIGSWFMVLRQWMRLGRTV